MKRTFGVLLVIAFIFMLIFEGSSAKEIPEDTQVRKFEFKDIDKDCGEFIDINNIEYITKVGGIFNKWMVLYPKKDTDKINKVINLVNSSPEGRKSTKEDLNFLRWRHGYPVDIVIKMNDGSTFKLMTVYSISIENDSKGTMITGIPYKDRYLLSYEKNNDLQYYTIFSGNIAEYLRKEPNDDIPLLQ